MSRYHKTGFLALMLAAATGSRLPFGRRTTGKFTERSPDPRWTKDRVERAQQKRENRQSRRRGGETNWWILLALGAVCLLIYSLFGAYQWFHSEAAKVTVVEYIQTATVGDVVKFIIMWTFITATWINSTSSSRK